MADEFLCCPACKRKLRLPESQFGWVVKCPFCGAVFRAPLRLAPPTPPTVEPATVVEPPKLERPAGAEHSEETEEEAEATAAMNRTHRALLVPGLVLLIQSVITVVVVTVPMLKGPAELADFWKAYIDEEAVKNYPENWVAELRQMPPAALSGVAALLAIGTIVGAIHILRLRRYPLAVIGSVLMMANLFYPGSMWLMNVLLGMWALMALRLPEVRAAFD